MPASRPVEDRLCEKFVVHPLGCWMWTAAVGTHGYGAFGWRGRVTTAHAAMWEVTFGPVPSGMTLDHLCRNRLCVNPAHLEVVSRGENVLRGEGFAAANARKTHCKHGHEFTEANTYRYGRGGKSRMCRACVRDRRATVQHDGR